MHTRSDTLAITPTVTAYAWMGVNRATHALFPGGVLELPHVFATSAYSNEELMDICGRIATQGFVQVIVNGIPPCFASMAMRLRDHGMKVGCVYHGFLAECGLNPFNSQAFKTILQLCRDGVIAKLACCKKGLPETIGRLTGLRAHKIMVPTRVTAASAGQTIRRRPGKCHIGVPGYDTFRKNIHNQVAAALLIEGATVHVSGNPDVAYWGCDHRVVPHPRSMAHRDYVSLLGQMDVNLHLSFSESWGQLTAESLAMGVPCLIANHSDVYDYDLTLRRRLVSENFDNPYELSNEVASVMEDREALSERCTRYVGVLNRKAEELLKEFLEE